MISTTTQTYLGKRTIHKHQRVLLHLPSLKPTPIQALILAPAEKRTLIRYLHEGTIYEKRVPNTLIIPSIPTTPNVPITPTAP